MSAAELLPALASICGRGGLLTGDDIGEQYTRDWAKTTSGRALAVALPATTAQTAAVLRECNKHGAPVVPQGGHTGLSGGGTPSEDGRQVILSLRRMSAVREVSAANKTMTAEAGCLLETAQQRAEAAGLLFPLNLAAKGSCQLGGNLATNAGGVNVLRYGTARDLCLGVEAVLANGETLNLLSGLRKDNSGYDLKNLIIGSEGTLAVIAAATFKLFLPSAPAFTAWAATPSVQAALDLLELMQRQTDGALSAFEMLSQPMFDLQRRHFPQARQPFSPPPQRAVLLEASGGDATAEAAMRALAAAQEGGLATQVAVAASEKQRREFWQTRELGPRCQCGAGRVAAHGHFAAFFGPRPLCGRDGNPPAANLPGFVHCGLWAFGRRQFAPQRPPPRRAAKPPPARGARHCRLCL